MNNIDSRILREIHVMCAQNMEDNKAILAILEKPKREVKAQPAVYFEEWWKAYPNKANKKKALDIWKRRNLDHKAMVIVADTVLRRKDCAKWRDGFVPLPTTYLNGDRWEDEIVKAAPQIEKLRVPGDDEGLVQWAKDNGFPVPGKNSTESYAHYRGRLWDLVRKREADNE